MSYPKKDWQGHVRPSFFWYDSDKDLKVCFLVTHLTCIHKYTYLVWFDSFLDGINSHDRNSVSRHNLLTQISARKIENYFPEQKINDKDYLSFAI